jgi:hypothetical protein
VPLEGPCAADRIRDFFDLAQLDADGVYVATVALDGLGEYASLGCGAAQGPEVVLPFNVPAAGRWRFETALDPEAGELGLIDTVLSVRAVCDDVTSELVCRDDFGGQQFSRVDLDVGADETIFLVVDTFDAEARGSVLLRATPGQTVAGGDTCDISGFPRGCDGELVCTPAGLQDVVGVCAERTAPEILAVAAFFNPETRGLGVRIEGLDREDNVTQVALTVLDDAGVEVDAPPYRSGVPTDPVRLEGGGGRFVLTAAGQFEFAVVPASIEVTVFDSTSLASESFTVLAEDLQAPEPILVGSACDSTGAFGVCDDGVYCFSPVPDGQPVCTALEPGVCLGEIGEALSAAVPVDGVYRIAGDSTGAPDLWAADCRASQGPEVLHAFTAPEAGDWVFSTQPDSINDTLMYVRRECVDIPDALNQLGCDDDGGVDLGSRVTVRLEQGETVYVVVEGYSNRSGTYGLVAQRATPPRLDAASVVVDAGLGLGETQVTGLAGTDPVVDVRVTFVSPGAPELAVVVSLFPDAEPGEAVDLVETFDLPEGLLVDARLTARVTLLTASGTESDPLVVPVAVPRPIARGEACDLPPTLVRACAPTDVCLDLGGAADPAPPACVDRLGECPAAWAVVDLDAAINPAGGWSVQGDNSQTPYRTEAACDRGTGNADVYAFTAAVAGNYRFVTSMLAMGVDTVLFARSACLDPAVDAELGCDDDGAGNLASELELALDAGETVYLFVTRYGEERGGAYTLLGERL